jgi:hypothetical protein
MTAYFHILYNSSFVSHPSSLARFLVEAGIFLDSVASETDLEPAQTPIELMAATVSSGEGGMKQPRCGFVHSFLSSAEAKMLELYVIEHRKTLPF